MSRENLTSTLNYAISVTYYLDLRNGISNYCISHILPKNVKIKCLNIIEEEQSYLIKNYVNSKMISHYVT
jgi:hypothetical protein